MRPPASVVFVARTHWIVAATIALSVGVLHLIMRNVRVVEFGAKTYLITGGLMLLYFTAGLLVWFGLPLGPILSRVCSLIYLPRPQLGERIWAVMKSPEFRAHFRPRNSSAPPSSA